MNPARRHSGRRVSVYVDPRQSNMPYNGINVEWRTDRVEL